MKFPTSHREPPPPKKKDSLFIVKKELMKITTWNVNDLRAALRKGYTEHLQQI